ncbi:unnamed protein product [Mucor circinelloides]|uniref:F-box domain-containing protein n=1 Tax=Mucor circinelloides f. circinelloides (strain 1006PhL) TaxID=1220926 RepID=S2K8A8_MUCC1|nr:hypothetical protein HMPREF1544_04715 [Mucor circinelloides 1006PhL]
MCAKASFATLPTEIMKQIIQSMEEDKNALLELQLTCQRSSQIARKVFYKTVDIIDGGDRTPLLVRTLQSNTSIAHLVEEILFNDGSFYHDDISLTTIIPLCPHLKIVAHGYECTTNYYTELLRLYRDGHLQEIERIGDPRPNFYGINIFSLDYNDLVVEMKKSITSLYATEFTNYSLIKNLKDFTHVRDIEVQSYSGISLIQVNKLLYGEYPRLKTIFVSNAVIPTDQQQAALDNLYSNISVMPQVEYLSIDFQVFSMLDLQLIMHMFPNLKKLDLNQVSAYALISKAFIADGKYLKAVICKFFSYLSHMDTFYAGRIQLSTDMLFASISNVAKTFRVCTSVSIELSWTHTVELHELTIKSKKHMSVAIEIILGRYQWTETFYNRLFSILAKEVDPLKVNILCSSGLNQQKRLLGGYIDSLIQFRHLNSLSMDSLPIGMLPMEVTKRIMKFNQLSISCCDLHPDFLLQMSQRIVFINKLEMDGNKKVNTITGSDEEFMLLHMPFTTFKAIDIWNYGHGRVNYIVKICLSSCITVFYVDKEGKNTKLTSDNYAQFKARFLEFIINCADLSFLKINGEVFEL